MDRNTVGVGAFILVVTLIELAITAIPFVRRKSHTPIRQREPDLVLLFIGLLSAYNVFLSMLGMGLPMPCVVRTWFHNLLLFLPATIILIRCIKLLFLVRITRDVLSKASTLSWFTRNRFLVKPRSILNFGMVVTIWHTILWVIVYSALVEDMSVLACPTMVWYETMRMLVLFGYVLPLVYIAWQLKHEENDLFRIKEELKYGVCIALLCIVMWRLGVAFGLDSPRDIATPWGILWPSAVQFCSCILCLAWPTYLTYEHEKRAELSTRSVEQLFERGNSCLLEAFVAFCGREYSSENPEFCSAVDSFKANNADTNTAMDIFNKYLRTDDAPFQVNVPGNMVREIQDKMDYLDTLQPHELVTLFDKPRAEIMRLMNKDSFQRFVKTREFSMAAQASAHSEENKENMIAMRVTVELQRMNSVSTMSSVSMSPD